MKYLITYLLVLLAPASRAASLASYNVDPKAITASGLSSGAMMAVQMHIAYSGTISGAGSFAGVVYDCAEGQLARALSACMHQPDQLDPARYVARVVSLAAAGQIDSPENLKMQTAFVYAGTADHVVHPANSDKLEQFYASLGVNVVSERKAGAAHGLPTLDFGASCTGGGAPWMLNCNHDGAGQVLKALHSLPNGRREAQASHVHEFSQIEFTDSGNSGSLNEKGWIYVPGHCASGKKCALHVALHGCQMDPSHIQDQFVLHAGYNEWAEANRIIVLYPQAIRKQPGNPYGCWDWWGFTGPDYATRNGKQMMAVKAMIDRVRGVH